MKLASLICVSVVALAAWGMGGALAAAPDGSGSTDAHNASTEHGAQGAPSGGASDQGSTRHGDTDSPPPPPPPPPPAERDSHSGVDSVAPDEPAADSAAAPPGREPTN